MTIERLRASFRDPSGFLFKRDGTLYRQVNQSYAVEYSRLMDSGLYEKLAKTNVLIQHEETNVPPMENEKAFKVIQPERVAFISYPYEWSFSQWKEAALTTLSIQKRALSYGLILKDASAYNIQFHQGKAVLIDTLSFESYQDGEPWIAYRQFCQHFLAPLALMAYRDIRLGQLSRIYIDGIPLDLAVSLLPRRIHWNLGLYTHLVLHSCAQEHYADIPLSEARHGRVMKKQALLGLVTSLERTIRRLNLRIKKTEWGEYYEATNYTQSAFTHKQKLVSEWSQRIRPRITWDLGANTGLFSRLAAGSAGFVVAFDVDPLAVETNWLQVRKNKEKNHLPLLLDLTNPSPALGWENRERDAIIDRGPASLILALALIHHLVISNNLSISQVAETFSHMGEWLIIEFIPKSDSQVHRLLRNRKDIFEDYRRESFESEFKKFFDIMETEQITDSPRWMYMMKKRQI